MSSKGRLPDGFGFTPETYKYRPDAQTPKRCTRTRSKTELKRSLTEEMVECSIQRPKKSKCQKNKNILPSDAGTTIISRLYENEGHQSEPKAKTLQPLVLPGHVEIKVDQNVEIDELPSPPPSLSPESGYDEGTDDATSQTKKPLARADAFDKDVCIESIEMDTILTSSVHDRTISPNPRQMPQDYIDTRPKDQPSAPSGLIIKTQPKPDQKTVILIPHSHQTDTEAGDYFGATLYTYKRTSGKKFTYQHLLKDIEDGYPAQNMRICEGDELVLIGQTFTPDLDHTEVLNRFHHDVKVDGKTRFCLILRKSDKKQSSWYWYETSAILSPDPREHHHNGVPIVEKPEIGPAKPKRFPPQQIVFSIYDTSLYMFIDKSGIQGVPIGQDDTSIFVNKTIEISFNPFSTKAALSGKDKTSYVRIDVRTDGQRNIRISDESTCTWFDCKMTGTDNTFQFDDFFLSYDKINQKFVMSKIKEGRSSVIFKDVRRLTGSDHPDGACAFELANMDAEEITPYFRNFSDSGYASPMGSQEKDIGTGDDADPTSPIFLSADNLDIDSSMM